MVNHNINQNIIFYTNNICESFNRTLNKKYVSFCKSMFNFQNSIKDVIKIYDKDSKYNDKHNSITKTLVHYVKSNNNFELITESYLKEIKKEYKKYLDENNLP